jgi:hypothetical protein
MTNLYSQFFLNTSSSIVQLELLEISHSSFSQTYRIVRNAINGVTVTLEDASVHTFAYYPVKIVPTGSNNDLDQVLQVQFGDLGQVVPLEVDRVLLTSSGGLPTSVTKPTLLYRTYRSDDLTEPLAGPYRFQVNNIAFQKEGATLQCTAPRLNLNRTGEIYSMDRFPMLRGFL